MYRPLPNQLTIRNSEIEGLGLFSEIKISKNSFIGVTHIRNESFPNSYIGKVGGKEGVKLEQQYLVGQNGLELMSHHPLEKI